MKQKIDYMELVLKIPIWILGIIAIYMLILKITGHSPTTDTIILTFLGIIGLALLHLYYYFGQFNNFVQETVPRMETNIQDSFTKVKEELKEIKQKLNFKK